MFESQALHDNPNTRQSVSVKSTNQNQAYKTSKSQFSQVNSTTQAVQRSDTLLQSSLQPQNQTFTQFRMFQNPSLFSWSWRTATNPQKPTQKDKKQTEVKYLEVFWKIIHQAKCPSEVNLLNLTYEAKPAKMLKMWGPTSLWATVFLLLMVLIPQWKLFQYIKSVQFVKQSHPPYTHGVITITLPPVGSLEDCMEVCLNM